MEVNIRKNYEQSKPRESEPATAGRPAGGQGGQQGGQNKPGQGGQQQGGQNKPGQQGGQQPDLKSKARQSRAFPFGNLFQPSGSFRFLIDHAFGDLC